VTRRLSGDSISLYPAFRLTISGEIKLLGRENERFNRTFNNVIRFDYITSRGPR